MAGPSVDTSITAHGSWPRRARCGFLLERLGRSLPLFPTAPLHTHCARLVAPPSSHPMPQGPSPGGGSGPRSGVLSLGPAHSPAQGMRLQIPQEVLRHEAGPLPEPGVLWVVAGAAYGEVALPSLLQNCELRIVSHCLQLRAVVKPLSLPEFEFQGAPLLWPEPCPLTPPATWSQGGRGRQSLIWLPSPATSSSL